VPCSQAFADCPPDSTYTHDFPNNIAMTRSMQGMFGASVSELYLLIKSLINIGRAVDLCVITKKYTAYIGTTDESDLAMIYS